jgi:hypothetical protein
VADRKPARKVKRPSLDLPSFEDLVDRIAALEQRSIGVADLPLASLQTRLESDWQPNASILLGSRSVTDGMLQSDVVHNAAGVSNIGGEFTTPQNSTWPGGAMRSTVVTVNHGLSFTPKLVLPMTNNNAGLTADPTIICFNYTATTFQFRVSTVDGQLPAAGLLVPAFFWVAVG